MGSMRITSVAGHSSRRAAGWLGGIAGVAMMLALALGAVACGGERDERGLAPADEVQVPFDADETEEQKRQEQERLVGEEAQDEASGDEPETREPRLAP